MRSITLTGILFLSLLACRPSKVRPDGLCVGKVLLRTCGQYIIQIDSGYVSSSRYVPSWTKAGTDSVFHKVFMVSEPGSVAQLDSIGVAYQGALFAFRFDIRPPGN